MKYDSIIILGATATGKTAISIELAKKLNTEIVNADSMYIYKDLSIGTAKPLPDEMDGVIHHVIDVAEPNEDFNVVDFRNAAKPIIAEMFNRNLTPIIVGGTGFYIDSLVKNYSYGNTSKSDQLRIQLEDDLKLHGKEFLYNKLIELNPDIATKLHMNDTVRVIRALEILITSESSNPILDNHEEPILKKPLFIGLNMQREILYDRINKRVDIMVDNGLIDEVKQLVDSGLTPETHQSMRGIGYKEIYDYIQGNCTLEYALDKIKQHTRNYAKRQITWFKRYDNIIWFDPLEEKDLVNKIISLL